MYESEMHQTCFYLRNQRLPMQKVTLNVLQTGSLKFVKEHTKQTSVREVS